MRKTALIAAIMIFSALTACKQERRTAIAYEKMPSYPAAFQKLG